jgi:TrmH family RNA methyltransferase
LQRISKKYLSRIAKLKQKKFRDLNQEYLLSGLNVVTAALQSGKIKVKACFVREDKEDYLKVLSSWLKNYSDISILLLTDRQFRTISDEENPQGIAILAVKPEPQPVKSGKIIYLDQINDPGNLGTIIRTACWFGMSDLLLSPESVDPFQPKVVRSSAGLITHINIIENATFPDLEQLKQDQHFMVLATFPDAAYPISQVQKSGNQKMIIAFGSEAHGIPEAFEPLIDQKVMIPAAGSGESLNLAISVGIVLYELSLGKSR